MRTNSSLYPLMVSLTSNCPYEVAYHWLFSSILALKGAVKPAALGMGRDSDATALYFGLFH